MEGILVSVSTGAMTSLLRKLATMMSDEYQLVKDVRNNIKFLNDELEAMHAFLLQMADVEEPDELAKLRVRAVRELSYDIEDNIDKFMVLVDHDPCSKKHGFKKLIDKIKNFINETKIHYQIAKEVKDIKNQVIGVSERYARYKIDEHSSTPRNNLIDPRVIAVFKDTSELVGIDGPRDELVKWLNIQGKSSPQLKVVSIVGFGGLGKTTLARQVYETLRASFDCYAFVSISRNPDMTKILNSILSQIRNKESSNIGLGDQQLTIGKIREFLRDKRYDLQLFFLHTKLHTVLMNEQ
jgi:hypothetical protein